MSASDPLVVVGIGCASASHEALESFFAPVLAAPGVAFIVVQQPGIDVPRRVPDLLRRSSCLPVVEVRDGHKLTANHIHVIPPGKSLLVSQITIQLIETNGLEGSLPPVNQLLRSLAADYGKRSVAVLLGAPHADGAQGLASIRQAGGLTLAQEPAPGAGSGARRRMSVSGRADIVTRAEFMPRQIAALLAGPDGGSDVIRVEEGDGWHPLDAIVALLRQRTGHDFASYKSSTLLRRVERRAALYPFEQLEDYSRFLRGNTQEIDLLFKELLIGVTAFFRDSEVWDQLRGEILPRVVAAAAPGQVLRAWVPACSTGEEAFSLAMAFAEAVGQLNPPGNCTLQIFATDLDPDAIERARKAVYSELALSKLTLAQRERFFTADGGGYRICKALRETVVFAPHNIISDPPFTKLDILCCRNLLIYFDQDLQKRLLQLFHYALGPGGLLVLGNAESVGHSERLFTSLNGRMRIFRRVDPLAPAPPINPFHSPARHEGADSSMQVQNHKTDNLGPLVDQLVQQNYAPAAVLVTVDGDLLYISGRTGKFLEPAAGKVNVNIHAMAREGLREALTGVLHKVHQDRRPAQLRNIRVGREGEPVLTVNVHVVPIEAPEPLRGRLLVVFHEVAPQARSRVRRSAVDRVAYDGLMLELQQTREALQATHEEMQTSVEELKSSNEELQSTNEELQSTNEELTTSKERTQMLNEELRHVNSELQCRIEDLKWVQNDMANLVNSAEIAAIFLDDEMRLRRFTPYAVRLFRLIPGDVGRPLSDIVTELDYPDLAEDAREVLSSLVFLERRADARDGRTFGVRIVPYRTQENVIDGVVMTFTDITELVGLQRAQGRHLV